jgi:hypothetical protein
MAGDPITHSGGARSLIRSRNRRAQLRNQRTLRCLQPLGRHVLPPNVRRVVPGTRPTLRLCAFWHVRVLKATSRCSASTLHLA